MKPIFSLCVVLATLLPMSVFGAAVEDRIVAVVNNDVITFLDLEKRMAPIMRKIAENPKMSDKAAVIGEMRRSVLDNMVDNVLLRQEARRLAIEVTGEDIQRAVDDVLAQNHIVLDDLKEELKRRGATMEEYRDELNLQLLKGKIVAKEIRPKITVRNEEIGEYYGKHKKDYEGKEERRLRQILFAVPRGADDAGKSSIKERAERVLNRLRAGESFEKLAVQYSQDPAAQSGGDLGFVERGVMFNVVDEAAFSLAPGEVSEVIESPVGYHIIKVVEMKGKGTKPLEEVRDEIEQIVGMEKMQKRLEKWFQDLRQQSHIEVRL